MFAIFKTSPVQPRHRLRSLLELESGSNDSMAVLLTITVLGIMVGEAAPGVHLIADIVISLTVGGLFGLLVGLIASRVLNRIKLSTIGLYPALAPWRCWSATRLSGQVRGN